MVQSVVRTLASLKIAVIVILAFAVTIAVGTFVEAKYNSEIAVKLVYKTPWMFLIFGVLVVNLAAVMVNRWPWKRRHIPFILAHIGIIALIVGAAITMFWGLDGTLSVGIGDKSGTVQVSGTTLSVWASFDGEKYTKLMDKEVDFYKEPPQPGKYVFPLNKKTWEVMEYWPFATSSKQVMQAASPASGGALRFQFLGSRAKVTEWIVEKKEGEGGSFAMGPAGVHLGPIKEKPEQNIISIEPINEGKEGFKYTIYYKDATRKPKLGKIQEGDTLPTGWMDFEFRIIRYFPHAEEKWKFEKLENPNAQTNAVIRLKIDDQEQWLQLDDSIRIFEENTAFYIVYGHRKIDLGFSIALDNFEMGKYPGTNRAASYQSLVSLENGERHTISMNEPLKYKGLTFYQASFSNGPSGKPEISVLSVNYDPGRWLKYLGSIILSLGIVWLFYDRRKPAAAAALKAKGSP
jgi:hypothetical protein